MFTEQQKLRLRALLEREQAALVAQLKQSQHSDKPVELDQNRVGRLSRMDALQGQAMLQAALARQRSRLAAIEASLQRMLYQDYGRCMECDEWVAIERLQFDPTAQYCIGCACAREQD